MLRCRVYRIEQPLTILGLELWELATFGGTFLVGLQVGQMAGATGAMVLMIAAGVAFGLMKLVGTVRERVPPGFAQDYIRWLASADVYEPRPDRITRPLVVDT